MVIEMEYEEFDKWVHEYFISSIKTKDEILKNKIINSFEVWYNKEKVEKIKQAIENKNGEALMAIVDEIIGLANSDDKIKLKSTYIDFSFNKMKNLSREIYNAVQDQIEKNIFVDENKINYYRNEINILEKSVSPLFKEDFLQEKSECFLDLYFLEKKGQVDVFSRRIFMKLDIFKKI